MNLFKNLIVLNFFIFLFSVIYAQQDSINPNGFNTFYYPNGFKSSEGNLKNGKPNGYWITYYVNGIKKSEGNRKNYMLDSIWNFYAENGDTTETIYYAKNKKNGFYQKYYSKFDSSKINRLKSKELYLNDKKQGFSFYYFPNGNLKLKAEYKDNYKHGKAFEYNANGKLLAIDEYRYNNLVSRQAVNRIDRNGNKSGKWVDIYDNGKVKTEINFQNGMPDGNFKEYSPSGKVLKIEKFVKGKVVSSIKKPTYDTLAIKNLKQKKEFYTNGKLKSLKTFQDSNLFGIQLYYDISGKIINAEIYNYLGIKQSQGIVDTLSNKQGKWTFFNDFGNIISEGNFVNNKKNGDWIFYYDDGKIFEKGKYENGYPEGVWTWFYSNGQILRLENYYFGKKSGITYEISRQGDTILKGKYSEGVKDGKWFFQIGDEFTSGEYYFGQKIDIWETYYYPEMRLKCKTNYVDSKKSGNHKCYYFNKEMKEIGIYSNGLKSGKWTYYKLDGNIDYTAEYSRGELIKVNDLQIK